MNVGCTLDLCYIVRFVYVYIVYFSLFLCCLWGNDDGDDRLRLWVPTSASPISLRYLDFLLIGHTHHTENRCAFDTLYLILTIMLSSTGFKSDEFEGHSCVLALGLGGRLRMLWVILLKNCSSQSVNIVSMSCASRSRVDTPASCICEGTNGASPTDTPLDVARVIVVITTHVVV